MHLFVVKRNGEKQDVRYDNITRRIQTMVDVEPSLSGAIDPGLVTQKVVSGIFSGIATTAIDELAAQTCAYLSTDHPDYGILAGRIAISNLEKETGYSFSHMIEMCHKRVSPHTKLKAPLIADDVYEIVLQNKDTLDTAIDYARDYNFDYFGFKVLERSYLLRIDDVIVERPQQMYMRVAVGIHKNDIVKVLETYDHLSRGYYTHATPTLFNAGTPTPQMSSCFLLTMKEDSIEGIYDTLKRCALISKCAGGIGLSVNCIRASRSHIRGTNGTSNGLVPMLKVYNDTARYVDQGGGKRKGAFAIYLEPWHADVLEWLELKKGTGKEEARSRDLFYALWVPDLFMRRVENDEMWSFFCPNEALGLDDVWGEEFEKLFLRYETEKRYRKQIKARTVWAAMIESQIETGTPYVLFKDVCNRKSNQKNLGTIKCSNLCSEIIQYSSPHEVAVCNLASIALPKFVRPALSTRSVDSRPARRTVFDHDLLFKIVYLVTINLNRIIDANYYPIPEARYSNMKHRPIGIGVQGLADVFIAMRLAWDSPEAAALNREIFETIYFAACTASKDLAKEHGPYESYQGSPMSKGLFQFDLWASPEKVSDRWNWELLRGEILKWGVRNSLLVALMPTASTSQILGNNECIEPYTSNIYSRRVLAGEFTVLNKQLLLDLMERGLWSFEMKNKIIAANGSVQDIAEIPEDLKRIYKTVWEISMRTLIDMAADRGQFVDQSQSFNCFMATPDYQRLTSMLFYAWKKGLKTGMYYLRTRPAADAIKFTVDQQVLKETTPSRVNKCSIDCDTCSA